MRTIDLLREHVKVMGIRTPEKEIAEAIRFLCDEIDLLQTQITELQNAVRSRAIHEPHP